MISELIKSKKLNERGFVMLELVVGLPLMVMMLWSMGHLFTNTWQKCRFAVADFILQQEMESVIVRIIENAKIASNIEIEDNGASLNLYYYEWENITDQPTLQQYRYFKHDGNICRGRTISSGRKNPLTGNDVLSSTMITKFIYKII